MAEQTEREKLISSKIQQGLLPDQAAEVVDAQIAEDKAAEEKKKKAK